MCTGLPTNLDVFDEVEVWEDVEDVECDFPGDDSTVSTLSACHSLVKWLVFFISLLQKKHFVPNAAISSLLLFLSIFFGIISKISPDLAFLVDQFPRTLYQLNNLMRIQEEKIVRYVICKKCSKLYDYNDCIKKVGDAFEIKLCDYKASDHTQPCNQALLRYVERPNKSMLYYPFKMYCYMPLYNYLNTLLSRPDFCDLCNHWKGKCADGLYRDVYDGLVWKQFMVYDSKPFLEASFTYGLALNIDWFQPCKHTTYSMGAVYLTVMNLPRNVRFRQENVLLIGLIPGPNEPKSINDILSPLVQELLTFWDGIEMQVFSSSIPVTVRCGLLCVACDIPASRKVCGFLGHSATLGCSKCMKKFPGAVGQKDYSGFDRTKWTARNLKEHRRNVASIRECTTLTGRSDLESKHGCQYTILLDIPYFDPITMTIIDPMHNLYLGSAKKLVHLWIEKGIITKSACSVIQDRVNSIRVPRYVGRIPHKIESSFSGFTADQFKNWTNLYSLMVLYDILPPDHLRCWRYFVLASRILCQMKISDHEIKLADAFLLQFCSLVEKLFGKQVITPNMHLHCHLKEALYAYGPVHNFWLYSYERYNGILESMPSNNRSLEIQLMARFYKEFNLYACSSQFMSDEYQEEFGELITAYLNPKLSGSLEVTIHGRHSDVVDPRKVKNWSIQASSLEIIFPKFYIRSASCSTMLSQLKNAYISLYPNMNKEKFGINAVVRKYSSVTFEGVNFNSRNESIVYVTDPVSLMARPVKLNYFVLHSLEYDDKVHPHAFAMVSWLKEHPARDIYGSPLEIWWKDLVDYDLNIFLPIQLLICHSIFCDIKYEHQTVYLMCPVKNVSKII